MEIIACFVKVDQWKSNLTVVIVKKPTEYIWKASLSFEETVEIFRCLYCNKGEILKVTGLKDGVTSSNSCCNLTFTSISSFLKSYYLYKNNCHEMFSSQEQCCFRLHYNREIKGHLDEVNKLQLTQAAAYISHRLTV